MAYRVAMASDQPYSGHIAAGAHRFAVRIYYEDTDAGGIVYHASYLRFMERARTDMLLRCGIDLAAAATAGIGHYVVADAHLRYGAPARLGEALVVVSHIVELRRAACVVQQNVMRDGQGITEGRLTIAFVGPDGRPRRQPSDWTEALAAVAGAASSA